MLLFGVNSPLKKWDGNLVSKISKTLFELGLDIGELLIGAEE